MRPHGDSGAGEDARVEKGGPGDRQTVVAGYSGKRDQMNGRE